MSKISDIIFNDHRELEKQYNNIKASKDADTAIRWRNKFVWELARHSIGEEIVVYPKFAKYLGQPGEEMANKDRNEHQVIKEYLYKFQSMKPNKEEFIPTIDALMANLRKHIQEEESHDYPLLESKLNAEESNHLAKVFERTKKFIPTHSHPSAPSKPPFETIAGLFATPVDKLRDMVSRWP
ncbi:cation binding protein [Schizosaccharomyces octosporus yFS286]|uniref:Cation binding protein n=1 Tax=Schizosaccharomyces octosporus (strain yFS286) TaxID=483514 RepID=S9PRB5_SCHOY|nr:cation binding protein [Schizosaccharomyces octosporus yFS286]EPX71716.1 cation binding protein [Schizosaccharomyces octosporus yFS286]